MALPYLTIFLYVASFSTGLSFAHHEIQFQKLGEYRQQLDDTGSFVIYWSIGHKTQSVTFDLFAKTTGFVGFGISRYEDGKGADGFIGGIHDDGSSYSGDYHITEHGKLARDHKDNWGLIDASENSTHTYLRVTRLLDTCDSEDIPIYETGTTRLFWILGKDELKFDDWSASPYGSKFANIFPLLTPALDPGTYKVWELEADFVFPDTEAHWCMVSKPPKSATGKIQILGYEGYFGSTEAIPLTHHQVLKSCTAPPGVDQDDLFGPLSKSLGSDCFNDKNTEISKYCKVGRLTRFSSGLRTIFPAGYGEEIEADAYYSFELHYANPNQTKFKSGLRIFYTEEPRKHIAYRVGITTNPSEQAIIIPPNLSSPSSWFKSVTHFPPSCVDSSGFTIFNSILHAHPGVMSMRLRHFRGGEELPWILYDEFYDSDYQQNINLEKEVKVLPGDHLMVECQYSTKKEVMLGQMCTTVLHVYTETNIRPEFNIGMSWLDVDRQMEVLGIRNQTTVFDGEHMVTTITQPESLAGELQEVLSNRFDWNPKILKEFQELYVYGTQNVICSSEGINYATSDHIVLKPEPVSMPIIGILDSYSKPSACLPRKPADNLSALSANSILPM